MHQPYVTWIKKSSQITCLILSDLINLP
jgi:hypothetical protein